MAVGGTGAGKGLLPHRCGGGRVPALWPGGRAVPTALLGEGAGI